MLSSLNSDRLKSLTLLPFIYTLATRITTVHDFTYLVASTWLPGIWILSRLGNHGLGDAALTFAAGYLCFISIYEIGYFANDAWDAQRSEAGRKRIRFAYGHAYVVAFIAVRIGVWAVVGTLLGWTGDLVWLAAFAALAVAFTEHNLIRPAAFRSASFFQLACLRFSIPMIGETPADKLLLLLFASIMFYTYFRFLAYLDGTDQLVMPRRRTGEFGMIHIVMLAPFIAFAAFASGEVLLLELLGYFVATYGVYALIARR
jgi:hypothetical protein